MSKAKLLFELQQIDLEIEQKTGTLAQIEEQLGNDDEVVSARADLADAHRRLLDLEHQQREAEWGVDELEKKVAVEEKKLYEGSDRNPRELMSLQQEIESLKAQRGQREEPLLAVMLEVDAVQAEASSKKAALEALEKQWQEDQTRLSREKSDLEGDLAALTQNRETAAGQIDADGLSTYAELRRVKQGLAVAKLVQGRCDGCRISLPVSDQQKARTGRSLATCSNCGRILYMD